jgi:hypothetical protein
MTPYVTYFIAMPIFRRYLLSVGVDGCIIIWSIADVLVRAMQERLIELSSIGKKKSVKQGALNLEGIPPPLPPKKKENEREQPPLPPASVLVTPVKDTSTGRDISSIDSSATTVPKNIPTNRAEVAGRESRWASRVDQEGGYELFGRNISKDKKEWNKYTLELTSGVDISATTDDTIQENDEIKHSPTDSNYPCDNEHNEEDDTKYQDLEDFDLGFEKEGIDRGTPIVEKITNQMGNNLENWLENMVSWGRVRCS